MEKIRTLWMTISLKKKLGIFALMLGLVMGFSIIFNILAINFVTDNFKLILDDNTRCNDFEEAMEEESKAFEVYVRDRSEENRAEYERSCARTEQGLESQPFDYEKIGSERYARTWNVKNSYENYSGQRDQVLLSESSRRIAEYDFSVPDLTVDNKDENGCPWKRAAGSYGCGLCGSFCLQGNGGSGS